MRKVYASDDPIQVAQLRDLLHANHVSCLIRNEFLMGAAGELPVNECWPEIWVLHDAELARACTLVEAFLTADDAGGGPWTCAGCGEPIEAVFSQCWKCGFERPPWEFAG